jgi:hypothetical protein
MTLRTEYDDGTAGPSPPEAASQEPSLDELLQEFDKSTRPPATEPAPVDVPAAPVPDWQSHLPPNSQYTHQSVVDRVDEMARTRALEEAGRDLEVACMQVRGDLDAGVYNDAFVQTWLDNQARSSPGIQHVWMNRERDPHAYYAAIEALEKKFAKTFSRAPDAEATADRNAVAAAVRGASGRAPPEPKPNYGRLSDAEFRREVREKYGYDPGV